MFDSKVRQIIDPGLEHIALSLAKLGVTANAMTIGGFLLGAGGCVAIGFQAYGVALVLIALNRIADGLDGSLARRNGPTDVGGFLDIVLDTIIYSGVPFAFAVARPECALPAAFLIYSFIGTGGSFLAFAAIAAKRGVTADRLGKKSFYYSVGLIEGTETVVFLIVICLFPSQFVVLAWTFGALCWITTAARVAAGVLTFRELNQEPK
jgi:phosphatidylglycerophosphate synthase